MGLPPDSIVAFTLNRMQSNLASRTAENDVTSERSGLLFLGNVHDAFPRQLFMDTRLSPLDKTAWVMIRLYAQQNDGAVFPTYDELQLQLASPHAEKASRETISRVLLMLRITGWLSLCKRVRDGRGRVRGNIYAQHDEPLSCRDAETFDPGWLDLVASSCEHRNKSVRMTALAVLAEIRNDPTMRHRHSRLTMIESRLGSAATPAQMASLRKDYHPGSVPELSVKSIKNSPPIPSSDTELSEGMGQTPPSSESELSLKSGSYAGVRKSNCNVRNFTQGVNKKTYVSSENDGKGHSAPELPESLLNKISSDDAVMLNAQLAALPDTQSSTLLGMLKHQLQRGQLTNPMGWMLKMLKLAREGQLVIPDTSAAKPSSRPASAALTPMQNTFRPAERASQERVSDVIADIRNSLLRGEW
ncbi:MAG: STY4528 family pathogenicity island replication protein [Rouxiella aceris]|uniref:STY4528 family pathogenicity island replication protein n=1 Tax=Rouxiella aceris TaxID=2703884 RepID=UPI0028411CD5|nr:STY4528 family pathogenicity island replication protein [Rouxiella aceris]MDR3430711.1 STY4528 family pathogenicity island replication protein [Rouxiella aceris]